MTDSDKPRFAQAIARLAVGLREPAPDVAMMQVYFAALKDREVEFLEMAADRLMVEARWFPKTSEWHAAAVRVEADRVEALHAAQRKSIVRLCAACDDTGWLTNEDGRVHRCECHELRRDELLGRRPWPALPPVLPPPPDREVSQAETVSLLATIARQTGLTVTPRQVPRVPALMFAEDDQGDAKEERHGQVHDRG